MQGTAVVTIAAPSQNPIAAVFNLDDENERRIFDIIQHFYGQDGYDRMQGIKRGSREGKRIAWTLGSFQPQRRGAKKEWMVVAWNVDEIEVRMQPCKNEQEARAAFKML